MYSAEWAAPAGSSLYYAALFHPARERRVLYACFAFLEEIRRHLPTADDATAAGRRLLWWREELEARRMAVSAHPLLVELRALPLPISEVSAALVPCVNAGLEELVGWRPESEAQWRSHCQALHAGVWQLAARTCAPASTADITNQIGTIAALCGQLQQVLELAPRTLAGRCPLPRTLLQSASFEAAANAALLSDPALPRAIKSALLELHAGLRQCAGREYITILPQFCRVLLHINLALCGQLLRQPHRVLTERVAMTPLRKLWIAWRQRG